MIKAASLGEIATALLAPDRAVPAGFKAGGRSERERGFAVYRNNVVVSLIDSLAETFPVTQALVGEDFFRAMARARVVADPPRSPVLIEYAQAFPGFVAGFAAAADVPYLADVARIEAHCVAAYDAEDAEPIPQAQYVELSARPDRLASTRITLHPACRWMRSRYAVHSLWSAHQGIEDMAQAEVGEIEVDQPEDILVVRPSLAVQVTVLPRGGIVFLDALRDHRTLGEAFASTRAADIDADPGSLFSILIQYGLVVGLDGNLEH